MLNYASARDTLVAELRANAADHDAARYDAIGRRFDRVEHEFPTGTAPELARLHIALAFWDGLEKDSDVSDSLVLSRFDLVAHPRLNERVQTLAARLRNRPQ
jgi:hypothetical protein